MTCKVTLTPRKKIIVLYKLLQRTLRTVTTKQQPVPPRNIQETYRSISFIDAKILNKIQTSIINLLKKYISGKEKFTRGIKMVQYQKICYTYSNKYREWLYNHLNKWQKYK